MYKNALAICNIIRFYLVRLLLRARNELADSVGVVEVAKSLGTTSGKPDNVEVGDVTVVVPSLYA